MKEYPSHFADVRKEIEDELDSLYIDEVIVQLLTEHTDLLGDYTTTWFVGYKRVAFFTVHWDEGGNQWKGYWKVFNNDIKE